MKETPFHKQDKPEENPSPGTLKSWMYKQISHRPQLLDVCEAVIFFLGVNFCFFQPEKNMILTYSKDFSCF
jgi:hypothetical protein